MDTMHKQQEGHEEAQATSQWPAIEPDDLAVFLDLARFGRDWIEDEQPVARRIDLPAGRVVTYDDLGDLVAKYEAVAR